MIRLIVTVVETLIIRALNPLEHEVFQFVFGESSHDGAEIVNGVADRVRAEMFRRIGLEDLLSPRVSA